MGCGRHKIPNSVTGTDRELYKLTSIYRHRTDLLTFRAIGKNNNECMQLY